MKKLLSILIALAAVISVVSCGASRKLERISEGGQGVDIIFSGSEYRTDKKYFRDKGVGVGKDLQELGRAVVDAQLSGLEIMEEKAFKQADGTFRYHVCMQLDKDSLSKAMGQAIDQDAELKLRADKDSFLVSLWAVLRYFTRLRRYSLYLSQSWTGLRATPDSIAALATADDTASSSLLSRAFGIM